MKTINKIKQLSVFFLLFTVLTFSGCLSRIGKDQLVKQALIAEEKKRIAGLPENTPDPSSTISDNDEKKIIDISKDETELTTPTPIEGDLIQTGGVVAQLATELAIDLDVSGSNVSQIIAIQKYIQDRWHYIHDPAKDRDTWRSAEATIRLRHNGKFPGDCDDFAILMASLAKQIGLQSRMVGGTYRGGGHAWAEFKLEREEENNPNLTSMYIYSYQDGLWVSLDWFKGIEHNRYMKDIEIFDGI
jgi:hypothetical protein